MSTKNKPYNTEFKAKIVLETLEAKLTLNQIADKYNILPSDINKWKDIFLETMSLVFDKSIQTEDHQERLETFEKDKNFSEKKPYLPYDLSEYIQDIVFLSDGKKIIISANNTLKILDMSTGECLYTFAGHKSEEKSNIIISPDGKKIIANGQKGTIKIWDIKTGRCLQTFTGHVDTTGLIELSSDGKKIASVGTDNTLKLWNTETGNCLLTLAEQERILQIAISPDGKKFISASQKSIKIWDIQTGECLHTLIIHPKEHHFVFLFVSPDSTKIIFSSRENINMWDIQTGECLHTFYNEKIRPTIISSDATKIISSGTKTISTRKKITSNGKYINLNIHCSTIKIWDIQTGQCLQTLTEENSTIDTLALSPDNNTIISSDASGAIRIWDIKTGNCLKTLTNNSAVKVIRISPNNKNFVSIGWIDSNLKIWDIETGDCLKTIYPFSDGNQIIFFSDDSFHATQNAVEKYIRIPSNCFRKLKYEELKYYWKKNLPICESMQNSHYID